MEVGSDLYLTEAGKLFEPATSGIKTISSVI
jgi:hypothetical protein